MIANGGRGLSYPKVVKGACVVCVTMQKRFQSPGMEYQGGK